ncbi:MAG: AraC family transcriptional regulator [Eubacteriales bacterium]|nr:AraC family transcriptional regulator [Eubacteriales bacterium]
MSVNSYPISDYLTLLYNATYMPMHLFEGEVLTAVYPPWAPPFEQLTVYRNALAFSDITFDYYVTDDALYVGYVRNLETDTTVIVGPISLSPLSAETRNRIARSSADDESTYEIIREYLERTPDFSLTRFLNIMGLLQAALNHEIIDAAQKYNEALAHVDHEIGRKHSTELMNRKENENYHNTYFFEQEYYSYVEKGDVDGLNNFLKVLPPITEGSIGPDHIRQSKNIFITTVTLATRHAIAGGLDIETAYQLSDTYIMEMEKLSDIHAINLLAYNAVFDFTRRVAEAKVPVGMTEEIFRCMQYISNHVNQPISVEQIAEELHMDRSTLSKKFKRELGFNISSFIMRRKLEEAKALLRHTDRSVGEISEYLCFSSQAYFQNVFKSRYGMTPREFRKQQNT